MRNLIRGLMVMAIASNAWAAPRPASAMPLSGSTYTVNSTLDEPDGDPADGQCLSSPGGYCTLRAAIMQANYQAGADTIRLPAGSYTLTRAGYDATALLGDLDISDDLTLQGAGSAVTTVDGNGAVTGDRVFQVLTTTLHLYLSGLTIRHGQARDPIDSDGRNGGGIQLDDRQRDVGRCDPLGQ